MTDVMTPVQRHKAMASNRGRTGPERALASVLWRLGLRFLTADGYRSRYGENLVGKPDLVFPRKRVVVFVDGCFWHGCQKCRGVPRQSGEFWANKIEANVKRDQHVTTQLQDEGWTVIRVPEHDVRMRAALRETVTRLAEQIAGNGRERCTFVDDGGKSE